MNWTCAHFADEARSHVRRVAELSAHLQVADAADGVPELCQAVRARHQQSSVGSDVAELSGDGGKYQYREEKHLREKTARKDRLTFSITAG